MGLMLTTSEHMRMLENEVDSYKRGLESMTKAHNRVLAQYRELRDSKDAQIADLHSEIESLKTQIYELRKDNGRLRQVVAHYEGLKKHGRIDNNNTVSAH